MRHIERHTYVLTYDKDKVNFFRLLDEVNLFKQAWPNAIVNAYPTGEVSIGYEGISNGNFVAQSAALEFLDKVSRHDWWEQV